jgi:hypothetical protein
MQQPHQLRGMHPCRIGLQANLAKIDPDGFADCPSIVANNLTDLSILVHEVAAFPKFTLMLLVEDLAASCAI